MGQGHLFAIHLMTAAGAAFALLSILAISRGDWYAAFVWLGVALLVDGIDGPIARRFRVRERLPKWDGAALDFVIDYTTYVFVPAIIVAQGLGLPPIVAEMTGLVIAVTGALYFADTRMKQPDNSFRGFPAVWNMAVFVMFALMPPPPLTVAVVLALAVLTFLPVNFVHPVRVVRWRALTLTMVAVWLASSLAVILSGFEASLATRAVLLASSLYLSGVAAFQQYLNRRSS